MRWMLLSEMAEYLRKSRGTIYKWINEYRLSRRKIGNDTYVCKDEVQALLDMDTRVFRPYPQLLAVMFAKIDRLEAQVEVLSYAAGEYKMVQYTDTEALTWYNTVCAFAGGEIPDKYWQTALEMAESLCDTLIEQLHRLEKYRAWIPVSLMLKHLSLSIQQHPRYNTDLSLQTLAVKAAKLIERTHRTALVHIEADLDSEARRILAQQVGGTTALPEHIKQQLLLDRLLKRKDGEEGDAVESTEETILKLIDEAKSLYTNPQATPYQKSKAAANLHRAARLSLNEYRTHLNNLPAKEKKKKIVKRKKKTK